ncbi:helicase-related protein [Paenibacillus sp. NRS-1775]|uniref:helicase-related protein n=1 Tax=unclassified Paenibacillus TaxID=185978 RepID=UPI003D274675
MVYQISKTIIPQHKREDINNKIIHVIDNNLTNKYGITSQIIYDTYTGNGGLHGLNFNDYGSFHGYTEAKKTIEEGQFFTPHLLSKFLIDCLEPSKDDIIADLTCGMGNLFNWLPNHQNVYGNELDIKAFKVAKFLYPKTNLSHDDIRNYEPQIKFDIVLGNPPFNLKWRYKKDEYLSQLFYCLKSFEILKPSGILALIVPLSFLADDFTDSGAIKVINEKFNYVYQAELPANSFESVGVQNFKTKIMFFQKKSEHVAVEQSYNNVVSSLVAVNELNSAIIYNKYIAPIMQEKEKIKHKLFYEQIQVDKKDEGFQQRIKKYLFDIKRNPKINVNYASCMEKVNQLTTQVKPESMSYEEWEKTCLTPNKVLSYLRRIIKNQHKKEKDVIRLVKTSRGLKLKAYSHKSKLKLSKSNGIKERSFVEMLVNDSYPFDDVSYRKVFKKKTNEFKRQSKPLRIIGQDNYISNWLENFNLYNKVKQETIKLKYFQKEDLRKILIKDKTLLAWNVGLGKTEAGITWIKYMNQHKNIRNTFIVSSSISIKMTWTERLESYEVPFKRIESLRDIEQLQPNDIVLVSFSMLTKYQRQIKKYIKHQARKVALVLDESHRCIYPSTKTTKAVISVFQRVPYKILASGTPTKNNANELYSQFTILYGSSYNFMCECPTILREDKKTGEFKEEQNRYYMKPFPSYNQSLFSACFSPKKASVFGIEKANQDIRNSDQLKKLIEKTIIVRSMFEVLNKDMIDFKTHRIQQNENEKEVYRQIIEQFHLMVRGYYGSTGNYRKDAMLRIIQQIQLMQKAVSIPHTMKEYRGFKEPNKFKTIKRIIDNSHKQKVAIGVTFIDSATYYYSKVRNEYPEREVFLILGETSFKKRQEIIKSFESTSNGILVSTQQSLSESVNIPSCDVVILEGLQYNIANIMQYIGRFTRLNSANKTTVHFVTYADTLEQNILALLMAKQRINEFVKNLEYKENADIFGEFGISLDVFNSLITKTYDEKGSVQLTWGRQEIN